MRKRLTKAQLYEQAKKAFFAFHVYRNPDGPGWIAHGIHRQYKSIWAATGETERKAIENLLFAKEQS